MSLHVENQIKRLSFWFADFFSCCFCFGRQCGRLHISLWISKGSCKVEKVRSIFSLVLSRLFESLSIDLEKYIICNILPYQIWEVPTKANRNQIVFVFFKYAHYNEANKCFLHVICINNVYMQTLSLTKICYWL